MTTKLRMVPAYLLCAGDQVDLLPWAQHHPDPDTREFLYEDGWTNRYEQEFCEVREVEHGNGVLVRFRMHPTLRFDPNELLPIRVKEN